MVEFRNGVIHRGVFPSQEKARQYAKWVYDFIVCVGAKLHERYKDAANAVISASILQRQL